MFPNILDFLSTDPAKPWLHYAVVLNGKLMATNNKMACYIDVRTFCNTEEQINNIEGKVFNSEDLIYMRNREIFFERKGYNYDISPMPYTGIIGKDREIRLFDDLMDDYNLVRGFKKFPDFTTIIPALTDHNIDVAKVQKRNTHFRGCGVAVPQMTAISKAFKQSEEGLFNLRFEFFHAAKDKDKADKPSAPILVTPFKSEFPLYYEACVINPVIINPVKDNSDLI
jgi:hypothetical protein